MSASSSIIASLRSLAPSRGFVAAGVACVIAGVGHRAAAAEELPLALSYDAPAECPPSGALRHAVEALVTRERLRPFAARVTIRKAGESFQSTIVSAGATPRVLSGASCEEVADATAVVLALAISPKSAADERTARDGTLAPLPAQPAKLQRIAPVAGARIRGDLGTLPHATLGLAGQLGLERGAWSLAGIGTYWLPQRATLPGQPAFGGDFEWWTIGTELCGSPTRGAVRLELCAAGELGRLAGTGRNVNQPRTSATIWAAASAGAALSWGVTRNLRLRVGAGAALAILGRRPFVLDAIGRVHEPNAVMARVDLGPELVF